MDDKECSAKEGDYEYTLAMGHEGDHEAHGFVGVLKTWPDETARKAAAYDGLTARVAELEGKATTLGDALDDAAVCLSCGHIGDDWRVERDITDEYNAICPKCGSEDVDEVEVAMRRLTKAHRAVNASSDAVHEAEALRQEAERELGAATARAEALEAAIREVGGIAEIDPYNPRRCDLEDAAGAIEECAGILAAALETTPPTDLTQHPAHRAGVKAGIEEAVAEADAMAAKSDTHGRRGMKPGTRMYWDEVAGIERDVASRLRRLLEAK